MGCFTDTQPFKIAKGGYVRVPRPEDCPDRRSKYPWSSLKEGDRIETPFPWEALQRVRISLRAWNRQNQTAITVDTFPQGTEEMREPHFIVGWSKGDTWNPDFPHRISQRYTKAPRKSGESLKLLKNHLRKHGPTKAADLSRAVGIHTSSVSKLLRDCPEAKLGPEGWELKAGKESPQASPK